MVPSKKAKAFPFLAAGIALATAVLVLCEGATIATAGQNLVLTGNYNTTEIDFTYSSGNTVAAENGGGDIPATLNGTSITYLYCLEFLKNVTDPGTLVTRSSTRPA